LAYKWGANDKKLFLVNRPHVARHNFKKWAKLPVINAMTSTPERLSPARGVSHRISKPQQGAECLFIDVAVFMHKSIGHELEDFSQ